MLEINGKIDIKSLLPEELETLLRELGQPGYRAGQLFSWLSRGCGDWDEMTNLPKSLRAALQERCFLSAPRVLRRQESQEDGTIKFLWEFADGNAVETVVMRYHYGNTVCISSQVGCRQGCAFCASAIGGKVRDLLPSEMLDEVLFSEKESGLPISHIVLMGIGEPLDNFDNVMRFLELVNHPKGRNIGMRHISLSTCGLLERFDDLAARDLQLTLSVSLHAPDDETRSRLMPANRGRGVDALFEKCREYYDRTGRRISFEYAMIDGVNDSPRQARELARRVRPLEAHVNLIPLNHVEERSFQPSSPDNLKRFVDILTRNGVNVTVRRRLGSDVDASCGQLRRKTVKVEQ
ncbi:MAG: 23S rRNA (adenine(2503)-C(2))-methyltransferase RlmN [Oscillospiraceae bacterium]|nr:23S rRNA (adenine(2503)-C(2))-methyltransferase RlmN [Oscillospiraceae bacterium]